MKLKFLFYFSRYDDLVASHSSAVAKLEHCQVRDMVYGSSLPYLYPPIEHLSIEIGNWILAPPNSTSKRHIVTLNNLHVRYSKIC
jgi:hypothetical protein